MKSPIIKTAYPKDYGEYFYFMVDGIKFKIWHYQNPRLYAYLNDDEQIELGFVDPNLYIYCTFDTIAYANKDSKKLYNFAMEKFDEAPMSEIKNKILSKASEKTPIYGLDLFEPKYLNRPIGKTSFSYNDICRHFDVIDWDVKLQCGINLQRGLVWSQTQKEEFIIHLLNGGHIPPFAVKIHNHSIFSIIDGKQRINTIKEFVEGKLGIFHDDYNGDFVQIYYSELNSHAKRRILHQTFDWEVIYTYDDDTLSDEELIEWFRRINFAGTNVEKDHLFNLYSHVRDGETDDLPF